MSIILIHLDDDRLCHIDIDPSSVSSFQADGDFAIATSFSGTRSDIDGARVDHDSRVAGLLDRLPEPGGEPIILSLSCGPTTSYALFRRKNDESHQVRIKVEDKAYLATDVRIFDLLNDTQRHFLAAQDVA